MGLQKRRPMSTKAITDTSLVRTRSPSKSALDEDLLASIRKYDALLPHPQRLQDIIKVSSSSPSFLQEEFRIRCAERICMMEERIPCFDEIPELEEVYTIHIENFKEMRKVRDNDSLENFLPVVRSIVDRGRDIIPLMCKGMSRLIDTQEEIDESFTNKFMNEFLLNRIGSNVLMSQFLAMATEGTSIVDPNCDVPSICREAARDVKQLCLEETGFRPTFKVESYHSTNDKDSRMENFAFIPGAISYMVQELLKNSAVATAKMKKNRKKNLSGATFRDNDDGSISVVVSCDERRVMIHIGDRAGGIPFDVGQHIWSYLYSTKRKRRQDSLKSATDLGGFGVGLPLSRLYASYLGGTMNLVSIPGYGTHAYVFLPRLAEKMVESVPIRACGWEANSNVEFIL